MPCPARARSLLPSHLTVACFNHTPQPIFIRFEPATTPAALAPPSGASPAPVTADERRDEQGAGRAQGFGGPRIVPWPQTSTGASAPDMDIDGSARGGPHPRGRPSSTECGIDGGGRSGRSGIVVNNPGSGAVELQSQARPAAKAHGSPRSFTPSTSTSTTERSTLDNAVQAVRGLFSPATSSESDVAV